MSKLTVTVIFGEQSSEHIVFCMSAANVIEHIDRTCYNILLVGITEERHWTKTDSLNGVKAGAWRGGTVTAPLPPDATRKCMILMNGDKIEEVKLDVVFPVLHGLYGEDGTIQGLPELARTPYMGCGVLASAVSTDKLYTKIIVSDLGIHQAEYEAVHREELFVTGQVAERTEKHFPYPVLIKPPNASSSRGISKADNRWELMDGLIEAARHGRKTLMEETIVGWETECAVFGGGTSVVEVSDVGKILAAAEFYDLDVRYFNEDSCTVTNPELPNGAAQRVHRVAMDIFRVVDGHDLARVDFFVKDDSEVVFNEINIMPGFTAISMHPMLWEARGTSKDQLVEKLLSHGMERYA